MSSRKREPDAKLAHIDICLTEQVECKKSAGFERYDFVNQAAFDISLEQIDLSTMFLGKKLNAPLMIAPMTGGVGRAHDLNLMWARAAEKYQIPMALGSQRVGLEDESRARFYHVRKDAPTTFLFGNIGMGQVARGYGPEEAKRAVDMIEADALFIHLNAIQEACQGGDVDFREFCQQLARICQALQAEGVPVFAREVGFGLSQDAVHRLLDCGVAGLDCAGAGGTSWAKVESICAKTPRRQKMGLQFAEWGIPTTRSLLNVRAISSEIPLIATGGLRSGLDLAKAIALGADIGAMARPFLLAAHAGEEALYEFVEDIFLELRICMFGIGAKNIQELKNTNSLISTQPEYGDTW